MMAAASTPSTLIARTEGFLTSSADHQDACFRVVQYACRLVGACHVGRWRESLYGVSNSLGNNVMALVCLGSDHGFQGARVIGC